MSQTIEDLKQNLAAAQAHQGALGKENRELSGKILEASRQAAIEKAQGARAGDRGDQLLATASDLDLEELRRREAVLPLETWAAHLRVSELSRDLDQALADEASAEAESLRAPLKAAQDEAKAAEARAHDLMNRHGGAADRSTRLYREVKKKNRQIAELENGAPVG